MIKLTLPKPTKALLLLFQLSLRYVSAAQNLHGKLVKCISERIKQESHFLSLSITVILFGID